VGISLVGAEAFAFRKATATFGLANSGQLIFVGGAKRLRRRAYGLRPAVGFSMVVLVGVQSVYG